MGAYDLSLGIDYLLFKGGEHSLPLLSANLYDRRQHRFFEPSKIIDTGAYKVGIIGLIDDDLKMDKIPDGRKIVVTDPVREAREIAPRLKAQGAGLVIALTDLKGGSVLKLARACRDIDIIISSDKRNQISLPVIEGNTYLTHLDRGGKCMGRLDILPAAQASGNDSFLARSQKLGANYIRHNFTQLRLSIPDHPAVAAMVAKGKIPIAEAQKKEIAEGKETDGESGCGTKYVGEEVCGKCHADRHRKWALSRHARAFATLVSRNRQYDAACVMCHALAYECEKGKLSLGGMENYQNVQCESCHGPGELHVKSKGRESMEPLPSSKSCLKCHTPAKSGERAFEKRFSTICRPDKPKDLPAEHLSPPL